MKKINTDEMVEQIILMIEKKEQELKLSSGKE